MHPCRQRGRRWPRRVADVCRSITYSLSRRRAIHDELLFVSSMTDMCCRIYSVFETENLHVDEYHLLSKSSNKVIELSNIIRFSKCQISNNWISEQLFKNPPSISLSWLPTPRSRFFIRTCYVVVQEARRTWPIMHFKTTSKLTFLEVF